MLNNTINIRQITAVTIIVEPVPHDKGRRNLQPDIIQIVIMDERFRLEKQGGDCGQMQDSFPSIHPAMRQRMSRIDDIFQK